MTVPSDGRLVSYEFRVEQLSGDPTQYQSLVYAWDAVNSRATGPALYTSASGTFDNVGGDRIGGGRVGLGADAGAESLTAPGGVTQPSALGIGGRVPSRGGELNGAGWGHPAFRPSWGAWGGS